MSHFWKGNSEELIKLCNANDINVIRKYFKDNEDMITILAASNSYNALKDLSQELTRGYNQLSDFIRYLQGHCEIQKQILPYLSRLSGAMSVASAVCCAKLRSNSAVAVAIEAKEYFNSTIPNFDFDALVRYLSEHHNNLCYVDDILKDLGLDAGFKMHLNNLMKTNMFFCRLLGQPMQTLELIDQGFRYAEYLKLKEHPEDYGW